MKYTWEQMHEFFMLYASKEHSNKIPFCKEMHCKFGISDEEAGVIWQAFDMAVEKCFTYNCAIFANME